MGGDLNPVVHQMGGPPGLQLGVIVEYFRPDR